MAEQRRLYEDSMSQLWANLGTSERCRVGLQEELAAHQCTIARLNSEKNQKDAALQCLHTQVAADEARIATLTAQVESVSHERDIAVERYERGAIEGTAYQQTIERLRSRQNAYQNAISELQVKVESDTTQIEVLVRQLNAATSEVQTLRDTVDRLVLRLDGYAGRISVLSQEVSDSKIEIADKDIEIAELKRLLVEARGIASEGVEYCHEFGVDPFAIEVCPALLNDIDKTMKMLSPTLISITHQVEGSVVWVLATWQPPADVSDDNDALHPTPITLRLELDPILYNDALLAPKFKITLRDADDHEEEFPAGHQIVHAMRMYMRRCWRRGFNPPVTSTSLASAPNIFAVNADPRCVVPYDAEEGGLIEHLVRYAMLRMKTYADFCVVCDRPIQYDKGLAVTCGSDLCEYSFHEVGVGYKAVGLDATPSTAPWLKMVRYVPEYATGEPINILMMTHVLYYLPAARNHAWVCSSGSTGYCAVKEMLQNGIPGSTLLIESGDLRDVDGSSEECCLRTYCLGGNEEEISVLCDASHVVVHANITRTPAKFLEGCTGLTALDLSPLSQVTEVQWCFLRGCTGLTTLDLSPLSQVTEVQWGFLEGCTGLTALGKVVDNPPPLCDPPTGWSKVVNQWVRE